MGDRATEPPSGPLTATTTSLPPRAFEQPQGSEVGHRLHSAAKTTAIKSLEHANHAEVARYPGRDFIRRWR